MESRIISRVSNHDTQTGMFYYRVFGIGIISEFALDSLLTCSAETLPKNPIIVKLSPVSSEFINEPIRDAGWYKFNEREFYYEIPDAIRFKVTDGKNISVEALTDDWRKVVLFFYSNAIAAALFQRGLIPFHVSGVLDNSGKVWLFAGHSKSGKSTTALMLKERGYKLFTDDTAILDVKNGKAVAIASYPMVRVWENTLEKQQAFNVAKAFQMRQGIDKYGIHFHEEFQKDPIEIAGMIFLNNKTETLRLESIDPLKAFGMLRQNVYRNYWTSKMGLEQKIFNLISQILSKIPTFVAYRPAKQVTFEEFAEMIEKKINI